MTTVNNSDFIARLPEEDQLAIKAGSTNPQDPGTGAKSPSPSSALQEIKSNPPPSGGGTSNQQQFVEHYDSQSDLASSALAETEPDYDDYYALPPIVARAEYDTALVEFRADPAVAELQAIAAFDGEAYLASVDETDSPEPLPPLEAAVTEVESAQQTVDELQSEAAAGNSAARLQLQSGAPQAAVAEAEAELESLVQAEISANQFEHRHIPVNNRTSYEIAANQVIGSFDGSAEGEAILRDVVDELKTDYIARQDRLDSLDSTAESIISADSDEAKLTAYTEALIAGEGDPLYQDALTTIVLRDDRAALGTWLNPEFINDQAESGAISDQGYREAAQAFVRAVNNDRLPTTEIGSAVEYYSQDGSTLNGTVLDGFLIGFQSPGPFGGTTNTFTPVQRFAEINQLLDAAGTNPETQQFRQEYAQYLNDTYVQNPNILNSDVRNVAAAGAALIISGDSSNPDLAQDFLSGLQEDNPEALNEFLDRASRGSSYFSVEGLESAQRLGHNLAYDAHDYAQPDAVAQLVTAFGEAGPNGDAATNEVALLLAKAPDDNNRWSDSDDPTTQQERRNAWATLLANHSEVIFDTLTDPSGLPTVQGTQVSAGFIGRSEDLGALLRFVQVADNNSDVVTAITDYNDQVRERIATADNADDAIDESRRLGFLAASITESVDQGFEAFEKDQAAQQALAGFVVDLAFSALPLGSLAKGATGSQIESLVKEHISEGFARDFVTSALKGFTGQIISSVDGTLTGAAREHIISQVGNEELGELVADLTEGNTFIQETLFADLPAPGYTPADDIQSGRADVILAARGAYDIALQALTN